MEPRPVTRRIFCDVMFGRYLEISFDCLQRVFAQGRKKRLIFFVIYALLLFCTYLPQVSCLFGAYKLSDLRGFIRPLGKKRIFLLYISLRMCEGVKNETFGIFGPGLHSIPCRLW